MKPPNDQYWTHGIPQQKKRTGVRITLEHISLVRIRGISTIWSAAWGRAHG